MDRSRTERTAGLIALPRPRSVRASRGAQPRVEDVLERGREGDERELEQRDREDRAEDVPERVAEEDRALAVREVQHDAPVLTRQRHEPEEDDAGLRVDGLR